MFSAIDWTIVGLYIAITGIGHRLKGRQESTRDFSWVVATSLGMPSVPRLSRTTISAVTFIGVPAIAFAAGGNFTYLQLALGGIIARLLIARYLLPRYYEHEYYSPYDFMSDRLGPVVGRVTAGLFMVGGVLGQSVRVYATALVIELLTGWSMGQKHPRHRSLCHLVDLDGWRGSGYLDRLRAILRTGPRCNRRACCHPFDTA